MSCRGTHSYPVECVTLSYGIDAEFLFCVIFMRFFLYETDNPSVMKNQLYSLLQHIN